jgi:hypothetical protein
MTVESPNNINKLSLLHCTIKKNPVGKKNNLVLRIPVCGCVSSPSIWKGDMMQNKRVDLCPTCGGCGSNGSSIHPGKCPKCEGKGYVEWTRNMISPPRQIQRMQQQEQQLRMDVCGNGD